MPARMDAWDRTLDVDLLKAIKWMNNETGKTIAKQIRRSQDFKNNTRTLRKSVRVKQSMFNKTSCFVKVGAPHAHLVEYGHNIYKGRGFSEYMIKKAGRNFGKKVRRMVSAGMKSGRVEGRHFAENAFNSIAEKIENDSVAAFAKSMGLNIS